MSGGLFGLKGTTALARLHSFIVFDGIVPPGDASEPIIYFAKCPPDAPPHFAVNLAGVLLTFRKFCAHFTSNIPFDYVATNNHEFAILELSDDIWMAVQRKLGASPNRNLLLSMLRSCKSIYELFWAAPRRIQGRADLPPRTIGLLGRVFEMIVNSITWTDLAFIQLFDSFLQLPPSAPFAETLGQIVRSVLGNSRVPIAHIAVLHSRYFIHSTFPLEVSRTLAMAISMKFPYLFPQRLAKQEERMYWVIGLSKGANGDVTVNTPPIILEGEMCPLVALRRLKLRILIALKPDADMTPELLGEIPRLIEPIMKHFRRVRVESCKGNKQGPYIVVRNESVSKKLTLSHEKISYPMIPVAENIIFLAQWFATTTGKNATVAFPAPGDFVICFRQETQGEVVVLYKVDVAGVSAAVDECKELEDPPNVTSLQILSG